MSPYRCLDGEHESPEPRQELGDILCERCGAHVCSLCGRVEIEPHLDRCWECEQIGLDEWVAEAEGEVREARARLQTAGKEYGYAKADLARTGKELERARSALEEFSSAVRLRSELDENERRARS